MRQSLLLIPIIGGALSGCGTVEKMNRLVNESTCSIDANTDAVQRSTQAVRRNAELVEASNRSIEENRKLLESQSH